MEDAVHRRECMITRGIDEECWHKMDLEFTSIMEIVKTHMARCRLTGHTLSNTDRTNPQASTTEVCPNLHWSPANVETKARPWYKNWLGWCPTRSMY